jgi:hypothetical protein
MKKKLKDLIRYTLIVSVSPATMAGFICGINYRAFKSGIEDMPDYLRKWIEKNEEKDASNKR